MSADDPKIFGVIVEHKAEQPLILEGPPATYNQASARLKTMLSRSDIIRGAIFKIGYVMGNETLIEKESQS